MLLDNKPYTFDRTVRIILGAGLLFIIIWLLDFLSSVLIPFVIALLIAYLINPFVILLNKKIQNHLICILLSLLFYISTLTLIGWLIFPLVINQFVEMSELLTGLIKNSNLTSQATERLPKEIWDPLRNFLISTDLKELLQTENFWTLLQSISSKLLPGVLGVVSGTTNLIIGILGIAVIMLYIIFILIDFQKISKGWQNLLPHKYKDSIIGFVEEFNKGMKRYFRGQSVVAGTVGILFAIGFTIINLPLGIILGLFIGLLNMVPYLQTLGLIPAYLFAILHAIDTGNSFWFAIMLVTVVFVIVQTFQDVFLVPKIMGKVTGLSPAMILLSLSIWGKLLGLFGLIIALPMTVLLLAYYKRFLDAEVQMTNNK